MTTEPSSKPFFKRRVSVVGLSEKDLAAVGKLVGAFEPIVAPVAAIDSRTLKGGEIFFALKGERTDGHLFVESALQKGARLAVVSEAWYRVHQHEFFEKLLVVEDVLRALQTLAQLYRRKFTVPVVAIGGCSGKTTTKEMTAAVLRSTYETVATEGNLNNHIGVPITLFGLREQTEIAVVEMGINHAGEMRMLCAIAEPTHGLITNIGKAHIEFFGSVEAIAEAEGELFEWLGQTGGSAFVNADDPNVLQVAEKVMQKILYGTVRAGNSARREVLDVWAEDIRLTEHGTATFKLATQDAEEIVQLRLVGRHNVFNALAAAAVGLNFGIPLVRIKDALERFDINPALKRMAVFEHNGVLIINDTYNANPDSMRAALDALRAVVCQGKRIAVLGDMLELGDFTTSEHRALGEYLTQLGIDVLFGYGEAMKAACEAAALKTVQHFLCKRDLVAAIKAVVQKGDAVLFKGSRGMKMEEVLNALLEGARTIGLSEREQDFSNA
ncbi:MAG: UDP-N-acetylmuramoyl-tripeptide--D-alanyl-D-alanine ligase [Chloroherpetonaceae bacterium]|nr:UDP-N-acetylmuramoyl-tripeptide--D-alanyl-D-alanine ligase [Chloroherpetonaceae bacterium]